jgi:hypothetical protein
VRSLCVSDAWDAGLAVEYGHAPVWPTLCASLSAGGHLYAGRPRTAAARDLWQAAKLECGCGARDFTHAKDGYMRCSYCGGQPR